MHLKNLWDSLQSEPIAAIARWQASRFQWILLAAFGMLMLILAHSVFQVWLYMNPCEHCVYIRFAFVCMVLGAVIAAINPKSAFFRLVGYVLAFYGVIKGIGYSIKLNTIHSVIRSADPFGMQGCSTDPVFPFGLPLDKWSPGWFKPTGECGFDYPIVPDNVTLNGLQQWLVNLYSDGWYLWPSSHFINMAQACLIIFGAILLILTIAALSWLVTIFRAKIVSLTTPVIH